MKDSPVAPSESGSRRIWANAYVLAIGVTLLGLLALIIYFRFASLSVPDIGLRSPEGISSLLSSWAKGEVIVLVRHEERCDRSTTPCLAALDGITVQGKEEAVAAGRIFEKLGVRNVDFFTSPAERTKQTARYMFEPDTIESERLSNCKSFTFGDVLKYKTAGRNLVLVTHSGCLEKIQNQLKDHVTGKPAYGSLLFILLDKETPVAAEYVEAKQLSATLMP